MTFWNMSNPSNGSLLATAHSVCKNCFHQIPKFQVLLYFVYRFFGVVSYYHLSCYYVSFSRLNFWSLIMHLLLFRCRERYQSLRCKGLPYEQYYFV